MEKWLSYVYRIMELLYKFFGFKSIVLIFHYCFQLSFCVTFLKVIMINLFLKIKQANA
jgi:hypothetical protein